jgi:hypothetical protein
MEAVAYLNQLQEMLDAGMTAPEIARMPKRTAHAIYARMQRLYRKRDPSSTPLSDAIPRRLMGHIARQIQVIRSISTISKRLNSRR